MSDRHRQYLAALGIPLWLSRRVLPGAAPPVPEPAGELPARAAAMASAAALAEAPDGAAPAAVATATVATADEAVEIEAVHAGHPAGPDAAGSDAAAALAAVPVPDAHSTPDRPGSDAPAAAVRLPAPAAAPAAAPAEPRVVARAVAQDRPVAATPVPADIDDWLPPEDEPPPGPARPAPRPVPVRTPPVPALGEPPADDWADYAAWAELAGSGDDEGEPAEPPPAGAPAPAPAPADERRARIARMDWDELAGAVAGCTACGLCRTRTQTVFGTGDRQARLMLVGEAPGRDEDAQGEPFVGEAGKLLNAMLGAAGLARSAVYIANVLKCRPPNNRDPLPAEALACRPHLDRQIALVAPALILALGRIPAHELLATQTPVGRLRGRLHRYGPAGIPLLVTWHPAYLLRAPAEKAKSLDDLERVLDVLEGRGTPA